jgi:hypothetical protein
LKGPVEGELPKLPPVRLRSHDPKTPESGAGVGFAFGNRSNPDAAPFEMLPLPVEPAVFGLGSYLDVPVGQDISSSGRLGCEFSDIHKLYCYRVVLQVSCLPVSFVVGFSTNAICWFVLFFFR